MKENIALQQTASKGLQVDYPSPSPPPTPTSSAPTPFSLLQVVTVEGLVGGVPKKDPLEN